MFSPLRRLKSLQLGTNPWACDCRLAPLWTWLRDRALLRYCEIYREISLIALLTFLLLRYSMPLATCQLKQRMSLVVTC